VEALAEQAIELEAGGSPHTPQPLAPGTDDNRLLTRSVHPDRGRDARAPVGLLAHLFNLYCDPIGQLLEQLECQLLADRLGDPKSLTAIGELIGRKPRGTRRQSTHDQV